MAVRAPVLDGQNCERFPEIALQRDTMKKRGIVCSWIMSRTTKWGKIVFKATPNSHTGILERLVEIGDHFVPDHSQRSSVFPPDPQAVTGMIARYVLII
jgi:hypothetical protein